MKSLLLFIIIILLTNPSFGQNSSYGFYRNLVIKKYKRYAKKNIYTIAITENDSSIFIHISGDTLYDTDKYFHFSSNGTCDREITSFSCEECYKKEIDFFLKDNLTKKIKINDSLYYGYHLFQPMMQIKMSSNCTIEESSIPLDKKTFKAMWKNNRVK